MINKKNEIIDILSEWQRKIQQARIIACLTLINLLTMKLDTHAQIFFPQISQNVFMRTTIIVLDFFSNF